MVQPEENDDETSPFTFLEQCCYWDLDGDGYKEPYIVTVDYGSREVARIVARFRDTDVKYSAKGNIYKINPWDFYTKFSFIPSPDGSFYDIGFGIVLGPINNSVNSLINQLLDAGTLSNLQSGFISKGIRMKGGSVNFTPGEWKYTNTVGEDLKSGIFPLPVREPSQTLFSLLSMMVSVGDKVASVPEIMTGDIPGQNTKATVALAAIEQGMKVFNAVYKRIHRSLSKEYKKLFKLNSIYLDPKEYFTILDEGQEQGTEIAKIDYSLEDVDVVPTSDPNVATEQQKLAKLEVIGQLLQLGTINPQEYTKRLLEATEQPNIPALMDVPPPQPDPAMELDKARFQDESQRAWAQLEITRLSTQIDDILKIAEAEKLEPGSQIEQYKQQLDLISKAVQAQQQFSQKQEMHQQKMDHMQQMNQLKQQQASQEANNAGTTNSSEQG